MSSRFWKITLLALAWTQTLGLTVLLVYIRDYQPVIVDQRAVAHPATSPHAFWKAADAGRRVDRDEAALDARLTAGLDGNSQFNEVFGSLDALDQAWALVDAESTFVAHAGPAASLPLTQILGAMLAVMMLVAAAVTAGIGTRGSVIGSGGSGIGDSELVRATVAARLTLL